MDKIKYTCNKCGWETSIRSEWSDLRPKRCMNKRCNTSFLAKPDALSVKMPEKLKQQKTAHEEAKKVKHGKKHKESGKSNE